MTYIAVALVMFILGYLCGTFSAAVGIWAEREKAKLVIDGMAAASRELLDAVSQLAHSAPSVSNTTRLDPNGQRTHTQSLSSSRGTN